MGICLVESPMPHGAHLPALGSRLRGANERCGSNSRLFGLPCFQNPTRTPPTTPFMLLLTRGSNSGRCRIICTRYAKWVLEITNRTGFGKKEECATNCVLA